MTQIENKTCPRWCPCRSHYIVALLSEEEKNQIRFYHRNPGFCPGDCPCRTQPYTSMRTPEEQRIVTLNHCMKIFPATHPETAVQGDVHWLDWHDSSQK